MGYRGYLLLVPNKHIVQNLFELHIRSPDHGTASNSDGTFQGLFAGEASGLWGRARVRLEL